PTQCSQTPGSVGRQPHGSSWIIGKLRIPADSSQRGDDDALLDTPDRRGFEDLRQTGPVAVPVATGIANKHRIGYDRTILGTQPAVGRNPRAQQTGSRHGGLEFVQLGPDLSRRRLVALPESPTSLSHVMLPFGLPPHVWFGSWYHFACFVRAEFGRASLSLVCQGIDTPPHRVPSRAQLVFPSLCAST